MPNFVLGLFLLGCLGGAVPDLLRIIKNRYKANLPKYLRSANFWIGLVILIGIGGLTAWILEATTAKDAAMGTLYTSLANILTPTKHRTSASPVFR